MLHLMMCVFRREENSPPEYGLLINEGDQILDKYGKPVSEVCTYTQRPYKFSAELNMDSEPNWKTQEAKP